MCNVPRRIETDCSNNSNGQTKYKQKETESEPLESVVLRTDCTSAFNRRFQSIIMIVTAYLTQQCFWDLFHPMHLSSDLSMQTQASCGTKVPTNESYTIPSQKEAWLLHI